MAFGLSTSLIILLYTALITHTNTTSNPTYLNSRCSSNTMFASKSKYQSNLNSLFLQLSSTAAINSSGNSTNNDVYGLFLCRGDLDIVSCKDCVVTATTDLSETYCPLMKTGVIWYDECMVRYSNESFLGRMVEYPRVIIWNSHNITGNQTRFSEVLKNTMNDLAVQAENGVSKIMFYAKEQRITEFLTLRAFVQCTPDLNGDYCRRCLQIAVSQLRVGSTGRILQPSCIVWYEVYKSNISSASSSGKDQLWIVVIIATTVPVASVSVAVLVLCLILKVSRKSAAIDVDEELINMESLRYDLHTLQSATDNFSTNNKIGIGGSGTVYKGILPDGRKVAVKWMGTPNSLLDLQFRNEVLSLAKLQHRNLIRLLGFCTDKTDKLLVFEYVPYDLQILFDDTQRTLHLDWGTRFQIIKGIAKGMLYLHQDSRLRIVHHDLKPSNVLLDEHMNPKIADFGLSTIFTDDQTKEDSETTIVGTVPYLCPNYLRTVRISFQTDVYSFGVVMLEILCGQTRSTFEQDQGYDSFLSYAREKWREGRVLEFVDSVDEAMTDFSIINQIERCMHLGLLCLEDNMDQRPTMATVVLMLESQSVTLPMPERPAYMSHHDSHTLNHGEPGQSVEPIVCSVNGITLTEIGPR